MRSILLTRPQAQSDRFAAMLKERFGSGLDITISPLLDIEFLEISVDLSRFDGLVFTSENGVRAYANGVGPRLPAYCVGDRTAQVASEIGLKAVSAGGSGTDLIALLRAQANGEKLLHIRGEVSAIDIVSPDLDIETVIAYRQVPRALSYDAARRLEAGSEMILPVFSPRTAQVLAKEIKSFPLGASVAICFSQAIAEILEPFDFALTRICDRPEMSIMIDEIAAVLDRPSA